MVQKTLSLENVRIGFRNFEGKEGKFNKAGDRSFAIFLEDHRLAEELLAEGWNVKFPKEQEEPSDPDEPVKDPFIQVALSFNNYPPTVVLISNGNPTRIGEDEVAMLDWAEIENVDVVLRPYTWTVRGQSGVKAYLKAGYFTIIQDQFAAKYGLV